ncbi:MAG: hypothetical protein ACOWWR_10775 [Eubacteriales bacterium]
MDLNKKFSLSHYDNSPNPSLYYKALKNSSQQFRDEIYDIYFGKTFKYEYRDKEDWDNHEKLHEVIYGNCYGIEASDEHVDNLFKIQQEFGIEISLTINQLNIPVELFYSRNDRVIGAFLEWLQQYYDMGLRSCTLANNHLMRSGMLHKRFPEMKWKNTVNQQVSYAQQVLDYLYMGYNVIQLDRSLSRNMDELKRIKEVIENYKAKHPDKFVKTCMLVWEHCTPFCPFKREHDDLDIYYNQVKYWDTKLWNYSCKRWTHLRKENILPRFGTDCYWASADTFREYAELVDIFKYGGRYTSIPRDVNAKLQMGWGFKTNAAAAVKSFSEIIENSLEPVHLWVAGIGIWSNIETDIDKIKGYLKGNFWMTDEGRKLECMAKNCKNQCYNCHLCEKTLGTPKIDSLMEL